MWNWGLDRNEHFLQSFLQFSYGFSHEPTSKSMFRVRRPSLFITSTELPVVTTSRRAGKCDSQKNTEHDDTTCKGLRLPRKLTMGVFKSAVPATQNAFCHVMKHVGMSQSAAPCHAKRSYMRRFNVSNLQN